MASNNQINVPMNIVNSNGGIVYSTATQLVVLAATAIAHQVILSGANSAPSWSTATYPATTTINQILYSSAANTITGLTTQNNSVLVTDNTGIPSFSTTLPSGIVIPGYANAPVNTNITSMTGLTGILKAPTGIQDSNGNLYLHFTSTPSAVNYVEITNNSTGQQPGIGSAGLDSTIGLQFSTKAAFFSFVDSTNTIAPPLRFYNAASTFYISLRAPTSQASNVNFILPGADGAASGYLLSTNGSGTLSFVNGSQIPGTATNDNASAGNIGQFVSSSILSGSAVTATSNADFDVTSISLTAGDWDVWGNILWPTVGTSPTVLKGWISTVSATAPDLSLTSLLTVTGIAGNNGFTVPGQRLSLSGTTTVYLSGHLSNSSGNGTVCGNIFARRRR